jgi:hypothetical protein
MSSGTYFLSSRNFEKDPPPEILHSTDSSLADPKQSMNGVGEIGAATFASTSAAIAGASLLNLASGSVLPLTPGAGSSAGSPLVIPPQRSNPGVQIISVRPRSNPAVILLRPGDPKVLKLVKDSITVDSDR